MRSKKFLFYRSLAAILLAALLLFCLFIFVDHVVQFIYHVIYLFHDTSVTVQVFQEQKANPLVAAAAIGGIASALGSIFGSSSSANAQRAINEQQLAFAREQMENNNQQNQIARDWQLFMQNKQNDWTEQNWLKTFNLENAYNSPVAQMSRLRQAGINPFVAAADIAHIDSSQKMSAPSSPSVSSPSSIGTSLNPSLGVPDLAGGFFSNLGQLAQMVKTLAEAKKSGAETTEIQTLLDSKLRELNANATATELNNDLVRQFGSKQMDADLQLKLTNISLNIAKAAESAASKDSLLALSQKYVADANLAKSNKKVVDDTLDAVVGLAWEKVHTQQQMTKTEKAKQEELQASAEEHRASATSHRSSAALNSALARLNNQQAEILERSAESLISKNASEAGKLEFDKNLSKAEFLKRLATLKNDITQSGLMTSKLLKEFNLLEMKEDNYRNYGMLQDLPMIGQILGFFTNFKY